MNSLGTFSFFPNEFMAATNLHHPKETVPEAAAVPFVREHLFVLSIRALSFGFV
jgi:hypothetical protein